MIEWDECNKGLPLTKIMDAEQKLGVKFPKEYVDLLLVSDGGAPKKTSFTFFCEDSGMERTDGIGSFLPHTKSEYGDFWSEIERPPEFFPSGLISFGETGGGDYVCFDYRNVKEKPVIVFWNHEAPEGKDVNFIANSFKEFLEILTEPEDL